MRAHVAPSLLALLAIPLFAWPLLAPPLGAQAPSVVFVDVTAASKVDFRHTNGAFGKKYLPETMGSGVVVFDFDGDGAQDLFFVNSTKWPGQPGPAGLPALYRNDGKGGFTDVTEAAGLAKMYGLGATAADYDNDGRTDLYVTCLGPNHLFRNLGGGKFEDVTAKAKVGDPGFSTSAMFFDYDKDGRLDLLVANYVAWSLDKDLFCTLDGKSKSYCTPESYKGQSLTLYHGRPDGTFEVLGLKQGSAYDVAASGSFEGEGVRKGIVAPADGVEIVTRGFGRLTGHVLDAAGHPVPEFHVSLSGDRQERSPVPYPGVSRDFTDDAGAFEFDDAPAGSLSVNASARGRRDAFVTGVVVEEGQTKEGVEIRLGRGSTLKGRVVEARSGRPVSEARIEADGVTATSDAS